MVNIKPLLDDIKKLLGVATDYTHFDTDISIHIETAKLKLKQLGIENYEKDYIRSYIYLQVRLLFDPPTNAFLVSAIEKQMQELEWRFNLEAEEGVV